MNEKTVSMELGHAIREWGVSGNHHEHVEFRRWIIKEAVSTLCLKPNVKKSMESIKKSKFPKDIRFAYEHVLHVSKSFNSVKNRMVFLVPFCRADAVFGTPNSESCSNAERAYRRRLHLCLHRQIL